MTRKDGKIVTHRPERNATETEPISQALELERLLELYADMTGEEQDRTKSYLKKLERICNLVKGRE